MVLILLWVSESWSVKQGVSQAQWPRGVWKCMGAGVHSGWHSDTASRPRNAGCPACCRASLTQVTDLRRSELGRSAVLNLGPFQDTMPFHSFKDCPGWHAPWFDLEYNPIARVIGWSRLWSCLKGKAICQDPHADVLCLGTAGSRELLFWSYPAFHRPSSYQESLFIDESQIFKIKIIMSIRSNFTRM